MTDPPADAASLRLFYRLSVDMLGIADLNGRFLELSDAWERTLGFSREELLATPYIDLVHPDDREATQAKAAEQFKGEEVIAFENRYRCRDGSYRWLEWNSTPSLEAGLIYFVARDITERRRMEQAQRDLDSRLRALMANLPQASAAELVKRVEVLRRIEQNLPLVVWMVDRDGTFIMHEGKAIESIGLKEGAFLGINILRDPKFAKQPVREGVQRAFEGETVHSFSEFAGLPWESWFFPLTDERSEVTAVVGISLDISEAKRAERELLAKIELIERQAKVIQELSTPIIEVWDKVLVVPMVGVIDSGRAAAVMDALLARIGRIGARFAILELTGVSAMDSGTANHLLKLTQAIRLLGAEGIITGLQPSVAQTMVTLGVNLGEVVTLATLHKGLQRCMTQLQRAG